MPLAPFQAIEVEFAQSLVDGNFEAAHAMLSPEAKANTTSHELRTRFTGMYRGYAQSEPTRVSFTEEFSGVEWPEKRPGDLGWVYVAIEGEGFAEAVTVTVVQTAESIGIRSVEWGRP